MTSRSRGPRKTTKPADTDPSSDAGRAPRDSSGEARKKTTRKKRSAGGAAEKRPPRVSRPPTLSDAPKKPAAKPAPIAKKPAPAPKKPAPAKAPAAEVRPVRPAAPERPARPAPRPQPLSAPAPARPESRQGPRSQAPSGVRPAQGRPQRPVRDADGRAPMAPQQRPQQRPPAPGGPGRPMQGPPPGHMQNRPQGPMQQPQRPMPPGAPGRPMGGPPPQRPMQQGPGMAPAGRSPAPTQRPPGGYGPGVMPPRPPQGAPMPPAQGPRGQGPSAPMRRPDGPPARPMPPQSGRAPQPGGAPHGPPPMRQQQHQQPMPPRAPQGQPPARRPEPPVAREPAPQRPAPAREPMREPMREPVREPSRPPVREPARAPAPPPPVDHEPDVDDAPDEGDESSRPVAGPPSADFNKKAHEEIFEKSIRFADLGLNEMVLKGVTDAGFEHPTSIQAKLIPTILSGRDVLGQAKTGTGKTASFALPMLSAIAKGEAYAGLVLVPTRELALQVAADYRELGRFTGLSVLPVYGGQNIRTQADHLARKPEIIVATPGRIMDMVQRGYVHYKHVKMVVLDEVDRMLDIGFRDDIKRILSACPPSRQTVFVSATLSPEIESLARSYAHDCEKIVASAGALTVAKVKQFYLTVEPWDKRALLRHLLTHESPALTVVFCRTKRTVDVLTESLNRHKIDAHAIHGDMHQGKRNSVIEKLRKGSLSVLVASDLASRGLDVEGITHVINYDLPEDPDLYVHRIGRTARAGRDGVAWSLVTPEQGPLLTQIELLINAEIPKLDYPDFAPGPVPKDVIASRELGAKRAQVAKSFNRFAASTPGAIGHVTSGSPADADPSKFPGGVVPTKLPPKLMRGRVKTARAMKQAIAQTLMPGAAVIPIKPDGAGAPGEGTDTPSEG